MVKVFRTEFSCSVSQLDSNLFKLSVTRRSCTCEFLMMHLKSYTVKATSSTSVIASTRGHSTVQSRTSSFVTNAISPK